MSQGKKPDPDKRAAVLEDFRVGHSRKEIARRQKLHRTTVSKILDESWRGLPPYG